MSKPEIRAPSLTGKFPLNGPARASAEVARSTAPSVSSASGPCSPLPVGARQGEFEPGRIPRRSPPRLARSTFFAAGGLAFALGLLSWTGHGGALVGLHGPLGIVAVLALWTLAVRAARSGVPARSAALAAAWGLVALVAGATHNFLLPGSWHWTLQVAHLALSMGMMASGRRLLASLAQREAIAHP